MLKMLIELPKQPSEDIEFDNGLDRQLSLTGFALFYKVLNETEGPDEAKLQAGLSFNTRYIEVVQARLKEAGIDPFEVHDEETIEEILTVIGNDGVKYKDVGEFVRSVEVSVSEKLLSGEFQDNITASQDAVLVAEQEARYGERAADSGSKPGTAGKF